MAAYGATVCECLLKVYRCSKSYGKIGTLEIAKDTAQVSAILLIRTRPREYHHLAWREIFAYYLLGNHICPVRLASSNELPPS